MRDGGPHTENQLLCYDCCFRGTPWKLRIARYRYIVTRGSVVKHIRLIKGVSYVIKLCLTDEYAINSVVFLTSRFYSKANWHDFSHM